MIMRKLFLFILMGCLLIGCNNDRSDGATLAQSTKTAADHEKNVIVIIIDSMTKDVLDESLNRGFLPALSFLMEKGMTHHDLVAPFPSMSVPIETTLITGTSPKEHLLPGLVWYDAQADTIVDYGSTLSKYWKLGMNDTLLNALVHLNSNHISPEVETIYEDLHQKGYSTGAINTIVYRGDSSHKVIVPGYIKALLHLPDQLETKGPDLLAFGQAVLPKAVQNKKLSDSIFQRFGLNDEFSAQVTETLIKEKEQPDFLMVFFPNYDKDAHKHGPVSPEHFANTDQHLQTILNAYDNWDEALERNIFVIMGDHGQDLLHPKKAEAAIDLEPILAPYTIASLLDEPNSGDIVIANNHRSAYLYPTSNNVHYEAITEKLRQDPRIDHISYLDGDEMVIHQVGKTGQLRVKENGSWKDEYNQTWEISGNEEIADIELTKQGTIKYGEYPDIFHQLDGALNSHGPTMVVTARPGHTIKSEGAPVHEAGGEHGGFHKNDTLASIIIAGTDKPLEKRRMEDLKNYFIDLLEE